MSLPTEVIAGANVKRRLTVAGFAGQLSHRTTLASFGLTTALNLAAYCASTNSLPPDQPVYGPVGGMHGTLYGSEGGRHRLQYLGSAAKTIAGAAWRCRPARTRPFRGWTRQKARVTIVSQSSLIV